MKTESVIGAVLLVVLLVILAVPVVHDATIDKVYHDNPGVGTAQYGTGQITITHSSSGYVANSQAVTVPSNIVLWNNSLYLSGNTLYIYENGGRTSTSLGTTWTLTLNQSGLLKIYYETGTGVNYVYTEYYSGYVSVGSTYHIKPSGSYVYVSSLTGARIDYDSTVMGLRATSTDLMHFYGDADNRRSYLQTAAGGIGDATLSYEWSDEDRAFKISGMTADLNGSEVTPQVYFVPVQYFSEEDKDGTAYQLLKFLPVLIGMGILIVLVQARKKAARI